jgi:adenylate cyclase
VTVAKLDRNPVLLVALLSLPLVGVVALLVAPEADATWEHHPSHFWLVLIAAALNGGLAYATGSAARRHADARLFLVSMAFLTAAGFLALHALATPRVLLDGLNAGFEMATPVGLLLAGGFALASSADLGDAARRAAVIGRAAYIRSGVLALMGLWAVLSLTGTPPLDDTTRLDRLSPGLIAVGAVGVAAYGVAVARYLGLYRRRRSTLVLGILVGFVLLAEAMAVSVVGRNWQLSWWEWHLLMLAAFAVIAYSAHAQWHEERFSDLYADSGEGADRELTVLFADLAGFTSFSERHSPAQVSAMLNEYFEVAIPPIVRRLGGEIDRIVGDALMVTFNKHDDQPDHAERAAAAGLEIQRATASLAAEREGWPRFRVGVNTGVATVTVLGTEGGRTRTVIGDVVNVASRIEGKAPAGGVAVGEATAARLAGASLRSLGAIEVKGREQPVVIYRLEGLDRD